MPQGIRHDEEIQRAFYAIEYSEFRYNENFHKSDQEREVDKLLRHFANIALAWQAGLLSSHDIRPIQYYVLRVMRDPEIQKYLKFMAQWSKQASLGEHPYAVLSKMSEILTKASRRMRLLSRAVDTYRYFVSTRNSQYQ